MRRRPRVALIATGDELVLPGTIPADSQIVCSNPYGVGAMLEAFGAETEFLGIARDTRTSLAAHLIERRELTLLSRLVALQLAITILSDQYCKSGAWPSISGRSPCGRGSR